ncbi:hypothetical protein V1517DRAFT_340336 [Lipomyces orientalis]|uniref:Uncharacterized protein n=1 Tax=Lipomyces orientalis TaxID=1233043 RepID=A0ACC3TIE7_9ASCO
MEVRSLPQPDNNNNSVEADLVCDLCFKSYQRRDLLLRHRRRCQGPRKLTNRRKACDACVLAKAKCCYTQPTCSRCAKRGIQCVYAASSGAPAPDDSEQRRDAADAADSNLQSSSSRIGNFAVSSQSFDLDLPAWYFPASPYSLETSDVAMADLAKFPPVTLPGFTATQPSMVHVSPDFTPSNQTLWLSPASRGISAPAPLASSSSDGVSSASSAATPPSPSTSLAIVRVLGEYPSLLMKGSFVSPILHLSLYSLYSNVVPDMTYLPLTSMAICCGSGINFPDGNRFFRRAMDAARERLIGSFPSYHCMQQWDALHAMLIYESLELRDRVGDESDAWKHTPRVNGLGSPFLLKVRRSFYPFPSLCLFLFSLFLLSPSRSHSIFPDGTKLTFTSQMTESYLGLYHEIRNPDISVFSDPNSAPCRAATSIWARWRITETARRTIFFANILNFYSNRDHSTGKQLPYYEPLNDELILNMPLPCSQAAWLARDEEDWSLAMKRHPPPTNHLLSDFNSRGRDALSSEIFLKTILSKFTKEDLQVEIGTSVGFADSDELRRLIILCASEQFA